MNFLTNFTEGSDAGPLGLAVTGVTRQLPACMASKCNLPSHFYCFWGKYIDQCVLLYLLQQQVKVRMASGGDQEQLDQQGRESRLPQTEDGKLHALCKDGKYGRIEEFIGNYQADLPSKLAYRRGVLMIWVYANTRSSQQWPLRSVKVVTETRRWSKLSRQQWVYAFAFGGIEWTCWLCPSAVGK